MNKSYTEIVEFLESLQIMPKTMPGLQKILKALQQTDWFQCIDPRKVIVVAGTNGKGSTCAMLEALLIEAGQKVGFYSSPHLITTTERIRLNQKSIKEENFVQVFTECEELIRSCELSHFEALTLMAGHYYFSKTWNLNLDFVILEVGLGGSFDATNAFPHQYSVITPIDFDHTAILGKTLVEIAQNKFGIVRPKNTVIHQKLANDLQKLKNEILSETNSSGIEVGHADFQIQKNKSHGPNYILKTQWGNTILALKGKRAAENAMTALTVFAALGFKPEVYLSALSRVNWGGRMQNIVWPNMSAPLYISGDHNPHGIKSLLDILKDFTWKKLYVVVGIGLDKDADEMLADLVQLPDTELYLTVTPFKGRSLSQYPEKYLKLAVDKKNSVRELLQQIAQKSSAEDLVVVTGSLYLVGDVLKELNQ